MSPWTALLEAVHSALIDEITERPPKPKPELGMPIRQAQFSIPDDVNTVLFCEILFDPARGFALLAFNQKFIDYFKTTPEDFWIATWKRAEAEFAKRKINPRHGAVQKLKAPSPELLKAQRTIWIPFTIEQQARCSLGIAV